MPLTLAEQGLAADGNDATAEDSCSSTAAATPNTDDSRARGTPTPVMPPPPPPPTTNIKSGPGEVERLSEQRGKGRSVEKDGGSGGTPLSTSCSPCSSSASCVSSSHRQRRVMASRARICGLLVERGARRAWRRTPSKQQATLDEKYAALLKDDDGRSFCTFSG